MEEKSLLFGQSLTDIVFETIKGLNIWKVLEKFLVSSIINISSYYWYKRIVSSSTDF